jgi:hypothetical protein
MGMGSSGGGFGPSSSSMGSGIGGVSAAAGGGSKAGLPRKGMQLGKSKGASSLLENLAKEEGVATLDEPTRAVAAGPTGTHVISGRGCAFDVPGCAALCVLLPSSLAMEGGGRGAGLALRWVLGVGVRGGGEGADDPTY